MLLTMMSVVAGMVLEKLTSSFQEVLGRGTNHTSKSLSLQSKEVPTDVYWVKVKVLATLIDGFQMSIKRPTSGGQTRDQEAAVPRTFHLERSSFFYLSVLMVRTRCSTY